MRVRFGDCVFDSETRELLRADRPVPVPPKAFQLLGVLIERRPNALSKDDLHAALWPDTFVADTALTTLVKELRAAIGDDARAPTFIRTVPAFGYAFSGEARDVRRTAPRGFHCRVIGPDCQVGLVEGENVFGRGPESILWVDEETVSRRHARIRVNGRNAVLEDLGSRNGTYVGNRRVEAPVDLRDGDRIRLGNLELRFRASESLASTRSATRKERRT
jgi:DNA-binding winged helix-turn-helix (wHTH) protein